jgi:NAD-dependent DNA ligase
VRQKDPSVTASRPLDIFLYHVSHREPGEFESHWEVLEALTAAGFPVNPRSERCPDIEAVLEYARRLEAERDTLGYDADGVVVKVNNLEQQRAARRHLPSPALGHRLRSSPLARRPPVSSTSPSMSGRQAPSPPRPASSPSSWPASR